MRLDANLVPRSYAAFVAWNRTCTICASGLSVHTGACCRIVLECVDCLWDKCCIRFGNEARLRDQIGHTWCVSSFLSRKNPRVQWWAHQEPQPPIRDNTTDRHGVIPFSHHASTHSILMSGHEAKCSFSGSTLIPRLSYQVQGLASPSSPKNWR